MHLGARCTRFHFNFTLTRCYAQGACANDDSEAGTAESEIACSDMHNFKAFRKQRFHGGASVALEMMRRMRQKSKVVLMVGFGVLVLLGLPCTVIPFPRTFQRRASTHMVLTRRLR